MRQKQAHLVNLGACARCGSKQYLAVRPRKNGLRIYLIVEDPARKRQYHQVAKLQNSELDHHRFINGGNPSSRDADSFRNLTAELRTKMAEFSKAVTEIEKCHIKAKENA